MGTYRVLKEHDFIGEGGKVFRKRPGELVEVDLRELADTLKMRGVVGSIEESHSVGHSPAAKGFRRTLRVGIWLRHSHHYSGGRLHMYQYAHSLAAAGVEVFFITTSHPRWRNDDPPAPNIRFVIEGRDKHPQDLDVLMTDSKGEIGLAAMRFKADHPWARFACLNFETANWVRKYAPSIAENMNKTHLREGYGKADLLLGNSEPSVKYLQEWMGETEADRRYGVLPPAVNTYRADADPAGVKYPERPYAVWSARNTGYKNAPLAVQSIWELDVPFDLVTFGEPNQTPLETELHKLHSFKNFPDATKYALYRRAHMVLAPSLFEGFGMVPGEAMSVGTPCVVYDLPVLHWAYGDRLVYVPWNKPDAFKATVRRVASEPKREMKRERIWVRETHGMEAMAERVEALPWHGFKRKRVEACMICYATPTAPLAIRSVYSLVEKIRIAYGPVEQWKDYPEGGVLEHLRAMDDPDGKIEIEARDVWRDKLEMRSALAAKIEGNYQLVLDADEIWQGLDKWLEAEIDFAAPRWVNLWHGTDYYIRDAKAGGRRWGAILPGGGSVCPHYRFSWWRPSYRWTRHWAPTDRAGSPVHSYERNKEAAEQTPESVIWHLGHALPPDLMTRKHDFYKARDGSPDSRREAWKNWNGEPGPCSDGVIEPVTLTVPDSIKELLCPAQTT